MLLDLDPIYGAGAKFQTTARSTQLDDEARLGDPVRADRQSSQIRPEAEFRNDKIVSRLAIPLQYRSSHALRAVRGPAVPVPRQVPEVAPAAVALGAERLKADQVCAGVPHLVRSASWTGNR